MGYINMKKFNKDKYLKKLRFKKYKRYLYIGIPCILVLLIGIYFAYSKFSVFKEEEVVRTTVGDFISGDDVIGAYIDGEYSKTIPGKNDGYIVDKIVCDNDASASWDNASWGIVLTNLTKRTKCNVYFKKQPSLTEAITTAMSNNLSMFATDDPGNNIRYIGEDPSNYVYFNCSDYNNQSVETCGLWRIIGVFNNVTKSDGSKENLVKIISAYSLGDYSWDYKKTGVGTSTTDWGSNDWSDSQLMMMLNPVDYLKSGYTYSGNIVSLGSQQLYSKMGSYYNGTKGCKPAEVVSGASFSCTEVDFTSRGLTNDTTRNAIEEVVWNLGGIEAYDTSTASMFYTAERGTTVYTGRPTTWTGKIGLMYPSDYGYATSGGTTKDRAACLAKELYKWYEDDFTDCVRNDYLSLEYYTERYKWTLAPYSAIADRVFSVSEIGNVGSGFTYGAAAVYPALFLKSSILVDKGTGAKSDPYTLKMQ